MRFERLWSRIVRSGRTDRRRVAGTTNAAPIVPVPIVPVPVGPSPSATAPSANGNATIVVPTFAPVTCTPSSVFIVVGGTSIVDCSAADYGALFGSIVSDPTIASVSLASPSNADFYAIVGLRPGTTTITFSTQSGQSFNTTATVVGP